MSDITVNTSSLGSTLTQLLTAETIEPGTDVGYGLCKALWEYHPLGGKLVEKPVRLAMSKEREITMDIQPKEMLVEAFKKEWEDSAPIHLYAWLEVAHPNVFKQWKAIHDIERSVDE